MNNNNNSFPLRHAVSMYRRPVSRGAGAPFKAPRMTGVSSGSAHVEGGALPVKKSSRGAVKRPLDVATEEAPKVDLSDDKRYFEVVWRKQTMKKHKTWDGDGVVVLSATDVLFKLDESENYKQRSKSGNVSKFTTDGVFSMGSFELEVTGEITDAVQIEKIRQSSKNVEHKSDDEHVVERPLKRPITVQRRTLATPNTQFKAVGPKVGETVKPEHFKPLHDPHADGAIVMKKRNENDTDVVLDPLLCESLRQHQIKGVKFLYECMMDLRGFGGHGALLADDMGLGKTLQTITLIWTLLKQSPRGFEHPEVSKVLIACPVTLVANWKREFKKWLPANRVNVLTLHSKNTLAKDKQDIKNFSRAKVYQVLIMGYEKIVNMKEELSQCGFDLLVCDEGHRLKNNSNKTLQALNSLDVEKKILLSGTPIQNDLVELFTMIDFINPGILGTYSQFKRDFMNPILRARDTNCHDPDIVQHGEDKSLELISITKPFILRRTSKVMSNHLPPRTDVVLFCPPTSLQLNLFQRVINSQNFLTMTSSEMSSSSCLGLITMFKKICNSPSLVIGDELFKGFVSEPNIAQTVSGKITVLLELLKEIHQIGEKVVIVSNYTKTLDIIQSHLQKLNFEYLRLDGSTPNKERDPLVARFNNSTSNSSFAFLLSAQSGGVGLNLIGASRLILFDNHWNPSVDLQAMARIHRDGQKRPVFIYRLITSGCIDEKIFQRQLMKSNLSDKFLDNKHSSKDKVFSMEDLKDLFTVNRDTQCNTHDLVECSCGGTGEELVIEDDEIQQKENTVPKLERQVSWTSALEIKNNPIEDKAEKERKSTIKMCLSDYRHLDPRIINIHDTSIGDTVVESLIEKNRTHVSYILTKVNKRI